MRLPVLNIRAKILLPFTLLCIVVTVATALVARALITHSLYDQATRQIEHASAMIARSDFALNPVILDKVKLLLNIDVVTYRQEGAVLASTLGPPMDQGLRSLLQAPGIMERLTGAETPFIMRNVSYLGHPYTIVYRSLQPFPDILVACIVETSHILQAQQNINTVIGSIALVVIGLMVLVSRVIAGSLTAPLQRLVESATTLTAGALTSTVESRSRDEIGVLTRAFNDMVQRLAASEAKLVHSERLAVAGQLAAGIAHEIRNPLAAMKLHVQLLCSVQATSCDTLQMVLHEIDRVEWAVQGLLDLAKPCEVHLALGDLNEVVRSTLHMTDAQLQHRKIAIERLLDETLPAVMLDAYRMKQAVLNLLLNAADAMPEGGTLSVITGHTQNDATVFLKLCDDGSGIAPTIRDRLFEPFFTTKPEGIGLGLANTRDIVEKHEGTLHLHNHEPQGTCAVITLPAPPLHSHSAAPSMREPSMPLET
jgi:signal transduction histidine kinase